MYGKIILRFFYCVLKLVTRGSMHIVTHHACSMQEQCAVTMTYIPD